MPGVVVDLVLFDKVDVESIQEIAECVERGGPALGVYGSSRLESRVHPVRLVATSRDPATPSDGRSAPIVEYLPR